MSSPQLNKVPASFNLTGTDAQFLEQGDKNIVAEVPANSFKQYFENSRFTYAYFCDFSEFHRLPGNASARYIDITQTVITNLFSELILPAFSGTDSSSIGTNRGYITKYVPYIVGRDMNTGLLATSYSTRLRVYDGSLTLLGNFGIVTPTTYNMFDLHTAELSTAAGNEGNATLTYASNPRYSLAIQNSGYPLRIEAFGLLYNVGILTP